MEEVWEAAQWVNIPLFAIHVYVEVGDNSVVHESDSAVVGVRIREFSFLCFLSHRYHRFSRPLDLRYDINIILPISDSLCSILFSRFFRL